MPRAARFNLTAIGDLVRQLRYAPEETRRRHLRAAEALLTEVEAERLYPEDFVIYRITGYRPEDKDPPSFVGAALIGDLGALVLTLSGGLELAPDDQGRRAIPLAEVAERLNVSTKTLQRYRRQGLCCHYVVFPDDGKRLACFEDSIERFVASRPDQVRRAASFTRVGDDDMSAIVDAARELHQQQGLNMNAAAERLAERFDRAHETIRAILQRHDRRASTPVFGEHGPLTDRDVRVIARAIERGVPIGRLAQRFGKTRQSILRAHRRARGDRLCRLELRWVEAPTFRLPDAASVILAGHVLRPIATTQSVLGDGIRLIRWAREDAAPPSAEQTSALIVALNFLKKRANETIAQFAPWPTAAMVDSAERDLRWVTRLRRRLVLVVLPDLIHVVEQHIGRPLDEERGSVVRDLLRLAVTTAADAADHVDPARDQRYERVANFRLARVLAQREAAGRPRRAAARHRAGDLDLDGVFDSLSPWDAWLEPPRGWAHVDLGDDEAADLLALTYGWGGARPHTTAEIAAQLDRSAGAVARQVHRAQALLRAATRGRPDAS